MVLKQLRWHLLVQRGYKTKPKSQLAHSCENCNSLYAGDLAPFPVGAEMTATITKITIYNNRCLGAGDPQKMSITFCYTGEHLHQNAIIFVYTLGPFEKGITSLLWWKAVDLVCQFSHCRLVLKRTKHNIDAASACPTVYFSVTFSIEMSSHQHAVAVRVVCSTTGGQVHAVAVWQ